MLRKHAPKKILFSLNLMTFFYQKNFFSNYYKSMKFGVESPFGIRKLFISGAKTGGIFFWKYFIFKIIQIFNISCLILVMHFALYRNPLENFQNV